MTTKRKERGKVVNVPQSPLSRAAQSLPPLPQSNNAAYFVVSCMLQPAGTRWSNGPWPMVNDQWCMVMVKSSYDIGRFCAVIGKEDGSDEDARMQGCKDVQEHGPSCAKPLKAACSALLIWQLRYLPQLSSFYSPVCIFYLLSACRYCFTRSRVGIIANMAEKSVFRIW